MRTSQISINATRKRTTVDNNIEQAISAGNSGNFDYSYVNTPARVACYDSLMTAPRVTEIPAGPTNEYIENLTTTIYEQSHMTGGKIPYTTIREVSENFIHARFTEIIVSILDEGNTIRFADQGPGISQKDKAQMPGFSSAIEPMKKYIRGVGSGLPLVREFLNSANGTITIEDNLQSGAVVTISLVQHEEKQEPAPVREKPVPVPVLSDRGKTIFKLIANHGPMGVTDIHKTADIPVSSISNEFKKLEEANLIAIATGKKRDLTEYGKKIANSI